jgi:formate/nitrite transporter FocA (FNT family)
MKNPLQHVKHLMKDPINTIAEANERKKEIMPWLYGSIALAVVPSVLGGAIDALGFLTIFGMIGFFANQLNTVIGSVCFTIGVVLLVISITIIGKNAHKDN